VGLFLVFRGSLGVVDLIVKDKKKLIGSLVVHGCNIWLIEKSVLHDLSENICFKVLIEFTLEDLVLRESLFWFHSFVDTVGFDDLLECLKLHGSLGILNWKSTERIELWILKVSQS
jgi:hypothetical protein